MLGEALRCLVWQHYSVQTLGCHWILEGEKKQTKGQDRSQPALTAPSDIFPLTQSSVHSQKKKKRWGEGRKEKNTPNLEMIAWGFLVALVVKKTPTNVGDIRDAGLTPGLGRSPGRG